MSSFVALVSPPEGMTSDGRWYVVRRNEILTTDDGRIPTADEPGIDPHEDPVFLGLLDGVPCWAVGVEAAVEPPEGTFFQALRMLAGRMEGVDWALAGRAVQMVEWARTSRFCGRCGTMTETSAGERAKRCPACGLLAYPRLAPAVIVLIQRGEEALLAQGRGFSGTYSTLAGFVEPGETIEEAVRREVKEEVGVNLGEVRYFASQPWPFPHSLMLGFLATWESGEIEPDGVEIVDARWFSRDDMPPIPPSISIARRLIDHWLTGAEAGS